MRNVEKYWRSKNSNNRILHFLVRILVGEFFPIYTGKNSPTKIRTKKRKILLFEFIKLQYLWTFHQYFCGGVFLCFQTNQIFNMPSCIFALHFSKWILSAVSSQLLMIFSFVGSQYLYEIFVPSMCFIGKI